MKLSMEIGLDLGHIMLDGDSSPPRGAPGHSPQFLSDICCGQMAVWNKIPLGTEVGLGPGDIVLDGDQLPLPKKGNTTAP